MKPFVIITLLWASSAAAQCLPKFEKPFEMGTGETLTLEIPLNTAKCSDCTKLMYTSNDEFKAAKLAEFHDGKFIVKINEAELPSNETTLRYRLICSGSFENGEIKIVKKSAGELAFENEQFRISILDKEAFNQKKAFRISVVPKDFPNAIVICSGCKEIDQIEPLQYKITPGFAGRISLRVTAVTAEGNALELGEWAIEFP
jgi:hypothetical protein